MMQSILKYEKKKKKSLQKSNNSNEFMENAQTR